MNPVLIVLLVFAVLGLGGAFAQRMVNSDPNQIWSRIPLWVPLMAVIVIVAIMIWSLLWGWLAYA